MTKPHEQQLINRYLRTNRPQKCKPSYRDSKFSKEAVKEMNERGNFDYEDTEPEAIFKVCQWKLEEENESA